MTTVTTDLGCPACFAFDEKSVDRKAVDVMSPQFIERLREVFLFGVGVGIVQTRSRYHRQYIAMLCTAHAEQIRLIAIRFAEDNHIPTDLVLDDLGLSAYEGGVVS